MTASFSFESCVVANCLSKNTISVVADKFVNNLSIDNIYYWRSFEIFRWVGLNVSDFYGEDDVFFIHVNEQKVNATIATFAAIFSDCQFFNFLDISKIISNFLAYLMLYFL